MKIPDATRSLSLFQSCSVPLVLFLVGCSHALPVDEKLANERAAFEGDLERLETKLEGSRQECEVFQRSLEDFSKGYENVEDAASQSSAATLRLIKLLEKAPVTAHAVFQLHDKIFEELPEGAGWKLQPLAKRTSCRQVQQYMGFKAAVQGSKKFHLPSKEKSRLGQMILARARHESSGRARLTALLLNASLVEMGVESGLIPVNDSTYFEVGRLLAAGQDAKMKVVAAQGNDPDPSMKSTPDRFSEEDWKLYNREFKQEMTQTQKYGKSMQWVLNRIPDPQ